MLETTQETSSVKKSFLFLVSKNKEGKQKEQDVDVAYRNEVWSASIVHTMIVEIAAIVLRPWYVLHETHILLPHLMHRVMILFAPA